MRAAAAAHYVDGRGALEAHHVAEAVREFKTALSLDPSKSNTMRDGRCASPQGLPFVPGRLKLVVGCLR